MNTNAVSGPSGLGGWLILPVLGMVISAGRLLVSLFTDFLPLYQEGTWEALTNSDSDTYLPWFAPLVVIETAVNAAFMLTQIWLLVLFFSCAKLFPRLYVWVAFANLAFVCIDAWATSRIFPGIQTVGAEIIPEIARPIVTVLIWVPYMSMSKRVKNTFVR